MPVTAPASSTDFLELVKQSGVLTDDRIKALPDPDDLPPEPNQAAAALVQKGFITKFQATQLLAGRHKGFRIGQYVIKDLLGRGGMGAVYLADHLDLHRKVAIKVLTPGKGDDQRLAVERFLREARAVAALDHPNIVRIFDVARQNDVPYLVMEFVDGETLQQTLDRERRLPHGIAAEYVAQAAAGLQHAHEKGFIHRDIKPGNLIRDRATGVIKILDMGLARSAEDQDKLTQQFDEGAVVGTADFISPEQAVNGDVDARADIYSLGATLYTLVVGKTPFSGSTTQKLMQHQIREAPPLHTVNLAVPQELSDVVAKMLAKKPGDRYQTAAEVIAALAPWAGDSSRVLAGISRTNLGAGDSQAALQARLGGQSSRLLARTNGPLTIDADEDTPSGAGKATKALSGADTSSGLPRKASAQPRNRKLLFAGIGAGVVVVGAIVAVLASGGEKKDVAKGDPPGVAPQPAPPPVNPNPQPPAPKPAPKPNPNPNPPPPPPARTEQARFATDFAGVKPFVTRSGLMVDPADPNRKNYLLISQSGAGALPTGWSARCWNKDGEMEVFAEANEGRPVLGIRNVRAPGSAMLFMPRFEAPSGVVRLRVEYAANVRDKSFVIRFKADDQRPAWDVARPAVGSDRWRSEEWLADLKGASGGYFEFHNNDNTPGAPVRLRSVSVVEPDPTSADRVVFKLDAYDLPGFRNQKTGRKKDGGEDDPRIRGVYFGGWKPETQSEWVCGPYLNAKALGITNLSEVVSAQIGIELESQSGIGAQFVPGQLVRMRVTYRTSGKGRGSIYFQNIDDRKVPDRATLPNSNNDWKTVELVTTRRDNPLRCLVDTTEKGAGNTLYVRSVTLSAVGDPRPVSAAPANPAPKQPAPKTSAANDPATWAEGATLYALDVSKIPAFRNQKEKGKRLGGDAEQLPAGIGCQCWRDGAVAEFRRDVFDGAPALGVTNLNNEKSGQYFFALEGSLKVPLQPGKAYRVKIGYQAANEASGSATVQVAPGYKALATVQLRAGAGWRTANASFVRPPAEDKVDVRLGIDNTAVGEGNTLWIRSLEVVELIPPKK